MTRKNIWIAGLAMPVMIAMLLLFAAFVMINDITKLPILSKVKP